MLSTIRELIGIMKSQKRQIILSILFSFVDGVLISVPIIIVFILVSKMSEFNKGISAALSVEAMYGYITLMIVCVIIRIVLRYFTLYFRGGAGYEVMCDERKALGNNMRKVSLGYLSEKNLGDLVSTITSDAAFLEIEGLGVLEKAAVGLPTFIIGFLLLLYFDIRIFLLSMVLLIPTWFAYKNLATMQDRRNINRQEFIGEVTEDALEFVKGIHVLKAYNMAEKQFSKTVSAFNKLKVFSIKTELAHIPAGSAFQFCFRLITVGIVFLSGIFVMGGTLSFYEACLLILASFSLFAGAETMGIYSIFSKMTQQSIDRMKRIYNIPKMSEVSGKSSLKRYDVAFDDVTFAYGEKNILEQISFHVPEKTMTALVGLSGNGKTTITNLIARFWDISKGQITIGGENIKNVPYESLLENLSFVFQDVFLFSDSILNNIRMGNPDAALEDIYKAAEKAGCHDFILNLPNGYDTVVGEGGSTLSGGEKQRISIARALIKDAPIILLDEVTANVDPDNEYQIQKALQELLKDKTVIMIAHKLATIRNANQILVLGNKKIIQRGSHDELMKEDGLYKNLWDIQYQTDSWKI